MAKRVPKPAWKRDSQFQPARVVAVQASLSGWQLEMEDGAQLWVDSEKEPPTGPAKIFGRIGSPVRGLVVRQQVIFYRTKAEERDRLEVLGPILVLSGSDALFPNRVNQSVTRWLQSCRPWLHDRASALLESDVAATKPANVIALWKVLASGDVSAIM